MPCKKSRLLSTLGQRSWDDLECVIWHTCSIVVVAQGLRLSREAPFVERPPWHAAISSVFPANQRAERRPIYFVG